MYHERGHVVLNILLVFTRDVVLGPDFQDFLRFSSKSLLALK